MDGRAPEVAALPDYLGLGGWVVDERFVLRRDVDTFVDMNEEGVLGATRPILRAPDGFFLFVAEGTLWSYAPEGPDVVFRGALSGEVRTVSDAARDVAFADVGHGGLVVLRRPVAGEPPLELTVVDADGTPRGAPTPVEVDALDDQAWLTAFGRGFALVTVTSTRFDEHAVHSRARLRFFDTRGAPLGDAGVLDELTHPDFIPLAPQVAAGDDDVVVAWDSVVYDPRSGSGPRRLRVVAVAPDGRRGHELELPMSTALLYRDGDNVLVVEGRAGCCDVGPSLLTWVGPHERSL